jgi:hypothetical protein
MNETFPQPLHTYDGFGKCFGARMLFTFPNNFPLEPAVAIGALKRLALF